MVNKAMDEAGRDRLVTNIIGHVKKGVQDPVLPRVFDYWRNIDKTTGDRVEEGVKA